MIQPQLSPIPTVAIIGAGFSGTATAVHLLRRPWNRPLRIVLIERGPEMGRGLAYARSDYPVLLNVPASRMSATMSDPDEFLRFARRRKPGTTGEDFLPRADYGDYLQDLLRTAAANAPPGVRLEQRREEVVDVRQAGRDQPVVLVLADGSRLMADAAVLAIGAPVSRTAAEFPFEAQPRPGPADPGISAIAQEFKDVILVVGTGLTMVDVVCATTGRNPAATIHAISRHGLLPREQTAFRPDALQDDGGLLAMSAGSVARLVRAARRLASESDRRGGDWREVVTLIRRQAPALWRSLSTEERGRFLRHVRAYWEVHRHRLPQVSLARLEDLRVRGRLSVHAGRIVSLGRSPGRIRATWVPRGSVEPRTLEVGRIIDCSGLDYDVTRAPGRLWRALLAQGLARPDELHLGLRTGSCGALVSRDGATSRRLFYVGPLLRADYWEATAVAELRMHVERLTGHLAEWLPHSRPLPVTPAEAGAYSY